MKSNALLMTADRYAKKSIHPARLENALAVERLASAARTLKTWVAFFGLALLFFMTGCAGKNMSADDSMGLQNAAQLKQRTARAKNGKKDPTASFLDMDRAAFAPVVPQGLFPEDLALDEEPDEEYTAEDEANATNPGLSLHLTRDFSGWDIVRTARAAFGTPYRRGGISPDTGFDCSGFTRWIYQQHGVDLPRPSWAQYKLGTPVSVRDLQPGDLLFFKTSRRGPSLHVTVYAGGDTFIHSPQSGGWVEESSINEPYWQKRFRGARRIGGSGQDLSGLTKSEKGS
jgi:cell wall-associated NlpC family hydrolase